MGKNILLVEDEEFTRVFLARFIERKGITVIAAGTGKQAIEEYKQNSPDCILLDLRLPDMEGIDVLKKIKEINPQAKIYFVSGFDDDYLQKQAENLGAAGYIQKPISLDDIAAFIEKL